MTLRYLSLCFLILFLVSCGRAPENSSVGDLRLDHVSDYLRVYNGDQAVLTYWLRPQRPDTLPEHYTRSGFIHPVHSPAGQVVTDGFPAGYAHQHGIFSAWTNTTFRDSFVDFWNQHKGLGTVEHVELLEKQDQDGFVGFKTRLEQRSLAHGVVLSEEWTVRVHARNDVFVWDLRSEQTNVSEDTLFLNKHIYGGFGFRGSKQWNPTDSLVFKGPAQFLTSQGFGVDSANHTRPEWTAIYGDQLLGKAGFAVLPHPENFRWPQPVRVHPTLPYFSVSPVVEEGFVIAPGETYLSRFRVVVFDGEPDAEVLEEVKW
ncbi:MAG: PmoA family protein [Bacteroidota bacterium]